MEKIQNIFTEISNYFSSHGTLAKIFGALIVLILGWVIINLIIAILDKVLTKKKFDETLKPFLLSTILWLLRVCLFLSVAGIVGVETTSFIAILGAVGFAIGMAMQGALGNLAGGALILLFRPFKVGDLIESQGHIGIVNEIQLFSTKLLSPENKTIILPNGAVSNGDIVNYTVEGVIRVDCAIGISYSADVEKAKAELMKVLESNRKVLKNPAPFVGVVEFADSSVNLTVRGYAKPEDYWDVFFSVNEACKVALDNANIEIPFPQMDVNLKK